MSAPSTRTMRARDMVKYSRYQVPRFAGVVVELDGKEIGAGAIVIGHKKRPFLSLEITDTLRKFPVFMHRTAHRLTRAGVLELGELYAIESADEPGAGKWLQRLGFVPTDELLNGERIYAHGSNPSSTSSGR